MPLTPYRFFQGTCAAAMTRYASLFGTGPLVVTRMSDGGLPVPPGKEHWLMHAMLPVDGGLLYASDDIEGGTPAMQGPSVMPEFQNFDRARAVFDALAEGGKVRMPFAGQFWTPGFGTLTDAWGIRRMIGVDAPQEGSAKGQPDRIDRTGRSCCRGRVRSGVVMRALVFVVLSVLLGPGAAAAESSAAARWLAQEAINSYCDGQGRFEPDGLIETDLTGDGRDDLVIYTGGLDCDTQAPCGAIYCDINIYVREGDLLVEKFALLTQCAELVPGNPPGVRTCNMDGGTWVVRWNGTTFD